MALWGFPLNSAMEAEVYVDLNAMDSANDWIEAPWGRAKMASSAPWLHRQSRLVKEPTTPANPMTSPATPVNPICSPTTLVNPYCSPITPVIQSSLKLPCCH
jgi:hypothetical protein